MSSESRAAVVRIESVERHPNADSLSIAHVTGYPVIIRTGDFAAGDLAVYVPVDLCLPVADPRFAFLAPRGADSAGRHRVRAVRLRGTFSMGLLVPADPAWTDGLDVTEAIGAVKYEPPIDLATGGENESCPGYLPTYTDIEPWRRWRDVPGVVVPGEEIVVTEKIHGANARFVYRDGRLWVGSHSCVKRYDPANIWWRVATRMGLEQRLFAYPGVVLFGEVFGKVQDLRYGIESDVGLVAFDAYDSMTGRYYDEDEFANLILHLGLNRVPVLYRGPWTDLAPLAEGGTVLANGAHVREGCVAKPTRERWHDGLGRVILKMHGEGYLLRKEKRP